MSQHELSPEQDPLLSTTPSAIQSANFFLRPFMIAEASMNFFGGTMMLLFPSQILSAISNPHSTYPLTESTTPSTSSIQLIQWLGALTWALSAPLLTASRVSATPYERRSSYITLASGEVALMAVMALQLAAGGTGAFGIGGAEGALTLKTIGVSFGVLGATVLPRAWALWSKAGWFEDGGASGGSSSARPKSRAS